MTKKSKESKSYLSTATTSKMWRIQTETNLMKTEDRLMRISFGVVGVDEVVQLLILQSASWTQQ